MSRRRPGRTHAHSRRAGFTLVEVLMAVTLLAVGLLALAGLAATSLRVVRGGAAQTRAAAIAQSRFDSLSSVPCAQIAAAVPASAPAVTGTATTRGVVESWSAEMINSGNMVRMKNALTVPGRAATFRYESRRACR